MRFPIASTAHYRDVVAARDHVAVRASLQPFFEPRSVAVLGASSRRGSIGGELFRNILAADFHGAAYPVNRKGDPVAGVRGYAGVGEIPDEVELAVLCLPGEHVIPRRRRGARGRRARARRHLRRLRRDRPGGRRAPGAAARARRAPTARA